MKYLWLFLWIGWCQQVDAQHEFTSDQRGLALKQFYLSLGVETHWIAGTHINWETGEADNLNTGQDVHTHCSAFVAAALKKLNIYILRPPEHLLQLLSNAQYDWLLSNDGRKKGWVAIDTGDIFSRAQEMADKGYVIICIYKNMDPKIPGHIALVRPADMTSEKLADAGPMLVMASTHNYNYISLRSGFSRHISNWPEKAILFYYNTFIPF